MRDEDKPQIVVARDGNEVMIDGRVLALRRRRAMRFTLLALIDAARDGRMLTCDELCRAVWHCDDEVSAQTRARAYTTIRRLRRSGFASVLVTNTDGYALRPDVCVEHVARDSIVVVDEARVSERTRAHTDDELRALLVRAANDGGATTEVRVIVKPTFAGATLIEECEVEVRSKATSRAWIAIACIADVDVARREVRRFTLEHARTRGDDPRASMWTNADLSPAGP